MAPSSLTTTEKEDMQFALRVENAVRTAQAWDDDPMLLAECRAMIPFEELRDDDSEYSDPKDMLFLSRNVRFLQHLARFFKKSMTWVNNPPCSSKETQHQEPRGPISEEEREGNASRVEVHKCKECQSITTFARYNSTRKLLETRRGRCGEYANVFGLYCRALGLATRYILDSTDHVWTEVWIDSENNWIMVDSCEGVVGESSMYEAGWGKKLSFIIGAANDHVCDVTPRYTRQFYTDEFQARRRAITSSEQAAKMVLEQMNQTLQSGLDSPKTRQDLNCRLAQEEELFQEYRNATKWTKEYGQGRISGSLAWKVARQEAGKDGSSGKEESLEKALPMQFHVETFFPPAQQVSIEIRPKPRSRHEGIVVSGAACAIGNPEMLSVVVIDEDYLGCILQSRAFVSITEFADFVDSLPIYRIVAVQGSLPDTETNAQVDEKKVGKQLAQLGGFDVNRLLKNGDGVVFVGQVGAKPDWAFCSAAAEAPECHRILMSSSDYNNDAQQKEIKLCTQRNKRPMCIVGRLPEAVMPLQTQLVANYEQKRTAFLSLVKNNNEKTEKYAGYTTKKGAPVYLLGGSAYPLEHVESSAEDQWNTFLVLPSCLVPADDVGIEEKAESDTNIGQLLPNFDVPLDSDFFTQHLGLELLEKQNGGLTDKTATVSALHNSRLVGLYFSAHWCGPCRAFTPMLAEMYSYLKEEYLSHGLEIVFVSSDRDGPSFDRYYGSMPWLSIPFETLATYKQVLSRKYGVRGIPSFVVLDAMSGQTVVSAGKSRGEIQQACSRGEEGIKSLFQDWLDRIPAESKEMFIMLSMSSCKETNTMKNDVDNDKASEAANPYLIRSQSTRSKEETSARIKTKFIDLVQEGMGPNEAAAKAIEFVSTQQQDHNTLPAGPLDGRFQVSPIDGVSWTEQCLSRMLATENGVEDVKVVLSTALKYLANAQKAPWTPKFRSFRLSNKVADRITRVEGAINLLRSVGFVVSPTSQDYCANIPIDADLDRMHSQLTELLEKQ